MATDLDRQTMLALDWPALLEALGDLARTALGRRRAGQLEPACDPEEASLLLETTEEALRLIEAGNGPAGLAEVADVVELLAACRRGEALEVEELRAVAGTVGGLAALARQLRSCGEGPRPLAPTLALWGRRLHLDPVLVDTLTGAFDERGGLSERTYPRLGELRREAAELERRARRSIEELLDSADFAEVLQDRYVTVRDGRFVVPIKAHAKSLGLGIVHDTSRSGQTVYLEPNQLVPLGNRRRLVEAEIAREELRIRRELSRLIGAQADAIEAAIEQAVAVDLAFARAELARRLDAVRPVVGREGTIALRAARHPLLVLQGTDVVPNDLEVTAEHPVLVLTGPNAGGKTVALKTIGICALLVRSGCFVPAAEGSRVDFFDSVLADIGDRQSIAEGLSSFSGHLRNLREMVERAGPAALLLCDEIASGTDPSQGGALARALVERMAEAGARVVVTTHYAQLKAMGAADERVVVAAMEFHGGRPTYRARLGVAGESHALEIARETGIDPALVARARSLMDEGERALGDALRELERERTRAERLAAELAAERRRLSQRERELSAREERLRQRARAVEREAAGEFLAALARAEQEVARVVAELQRQPSHAGAERARRALRRMRREVSSYVAGPAPARRPQVGDRVRIERLGTTGVVEAVQGERLEVRAGGIAVRVKADEVTLVEPSAQAEGRGLRAGEPPSPAAPSTSGQQLGGARRPGDIVRTARNTIDLRGCRVGQARERLEAFLDRATLEGLDGVLVVHGHGTEALKQAVREMLAHSPYVREFAPGDQAQGGDGVTAVVLR